MFYLNLYRGFINIEVFNKREFRRSVRSEWLTKQCLHTLILGARENNRIFCISFGTN